MEFASSFLSFLFFSFVEDFSISIFLTLSCHNYSTEKLNLESFGGDLTIDEYRKKTTHLNYDINITPIIPIHHTYYKYDAKIKLIIEGCNKYTNQFTPNSLKKTPCNISTKKPFEVQKSLIGKNCFVK